MQKMVGIIYQAVQSRAKKSTLEIEVETSGDRPDHRVVGVACKTSTVKNFGFQVVHPIHTFPTPLLQPLTLNKHTCLFDLKLID